MADKINLDKLDKDWRRQAEDIVDNKPTARVEKDEYHDELTEILKKRAHIDGEVTPEKRKSRGRG